MVRTYIKHSHETLFTFFFLFFAIFGHVYAFDKFLLLRIRKRCCLFVVCFPDVEPTVVEF